MNEQIMVEKTVTVNNPKEDLYRFWRNACEFAAVYLSSYTSIANQGRALVLSFPG